MSSGNGHGFREPPPTAGAVDLNALKRNTGAQDEVDEAVVQLLARAGLICPCGERIRDEGVEYLALVKATVATPAGEQPSVGIGATFFHSRTCNALLQLLASEQ